jgi:hypothetical protein
MGRRDIVFQHTADKYIARSGKWIVNKKAADREPSRARSPSFVIYLQATPNKYGGAGIYTCVKDVT